MDDLKVTANSIETAQIVHLTGKRYAASVEMAINNSDRRRIYDPAFQFSKSTSVVPFIIMRSKRIEASSRRVSRDVFRECRRRMGGK